MNRYRFLLLGGKFIDAWGDNIRDAMLAAEAEQGVTVMWGQSYTDPESFHADKDARFRTLRKLRDDELQATQ